MSIQYEFVFQGLRIDKPALDHMLNSKTGEVGIWLKNRGMLMMMAAKAQVGVQSGELRDSIHMRQTRDPFGQRMEIGSKLNYALMHHEGTKPHVITPNDANILRFSAGGRVVYTHKVNHPGTRPNKFLSDQLYMIRL